MTDYDPQDVLVCSFVSLSLTFDDIKDIFPGLSKEQAERIYKHIDSFERYLGKQGITINDVDKYLEKL